MKSKLDETSQRYLLLFKLDAIRLFERLKYRKPEYIEIFALKRTREHFKSVFYSRYHHATIQDLVHCGQDIIMALDEFYHLIDELRWYLDHTEDMPVTIDEVIERELRKLKHGLEKVELYINAELGVINESNNINGLPSLPPENESN